MPSVEELQKSMGYVKAPWIDLMEQARIFLQDKSQPQETKNLVHGLKCEIDNMRSSNERLAGKLSQQERTIESLKAK